MKKTVMLLMLGTVALSNVADACSRWDGEVPCFQEYQSSGSCENGNTHYVGVSGSSGNKNKITSLSGGAQGFVGGSQTDSCSYTFYRLDCNGEWYSQYISYTYSDPEPGQACYGTGTGSGGS